MALFGNDPIPTVTLPPIPSTPMTPDEERRRYALDQTIRVTVVGSVTIADVIAGAAQIEAYLRGPTGEPT